MKEFELSRIDPISLGKISAAMYAVIGVLMILIYAPFVLIFMIGAGEAAVALGGLLLGLIGAVFGIAFYAGFGFVFGALMGYFYNLIADRFGGLEVEFKEN
ncbi:hypothetical protein [Candidatus Nanohalobium constans]|uniref:DUF3566 domain-containing protein n=1 Tax=Candidatus Nanohalobium constans TaxID=2565781 RepID=A0A5Q0UFJ6_9ARCH|nr:hypothetical protein [Candidatus Nanohalobium constans]QGA80141.1 hypothetical protein LC1Nh_0237 [Candidatus Nanohalobium constans]